MKVAQTLQPSNTYAEFCTAMQRRTLVRVVSPTTQREATGVINAIRPEDGSGKNWLITVNSREGSNHTGDVELFVRLAA